MDLCTPHLVSLFVPVPPTPLVQQMTDRSIIPASMPPTASLPTASDDDEQASPIQCYLADNVHLRTEGDILSFTNLMASSSGNRSSLRALHISVGKVGSPAAAALVIWLSRLRAELCARLTSLELDGDTEGFLSSSPELPGAFAGLTTLRIVRMDPVRTLGADMLQHMKSSLVSADLALDVILDWGVPTLEQRCMSNPVFLLRGSQNTLETLKASWALTDDNASLGIRYPRVRELDLDCVDIPLTYDYVRAFPNASRLSISSVRFSGDEEMPEAIPYRLANQREQREYGSWGALAVVDCSLLDAYLLGLRCPVSTLQLSLNGTGESHEWCTRMFYAVLDDVHPTVLRLTMGSPRILLEPSLLSALSPGRTPQLETLAITYEVIVRDTAAIVQEALMWILQELVSVPVATFELEIDCKNAYAGEPDAEADELYLGRSGEGYFGDLDLRELAREFMSFIETARLYDPSEDRDSEDGIGEDGREGSDSKYEGEDGEVYVESQLSEPESSQQEVERMIIVEGW
ncbi:hypothetical protein V8D89_008539 [Ganoderma adspersum]